MLARVSFAGTSMLAPLILTGVLSNKVMGNEIIVATALALVVFILSLLGAIPSEVGPVRMDLFLLLSLGIFSLVSNALRPTQKEAQRSAVGSKH
jgi:SSS family solute:Na+ symporter